MPNKITIKRSSVVGKSPQAADLDYGELAINYADGKLYYKTSDNTIDSFNSNAASSRSITTSSINPTTLSSVPIAVYASGKYLIQATRGNFRQVTEFLIVHDGTSVYGTEYGTILTDSNTPLFSVDVDINNGNMRVIVTSTSATTTNFVTTFTLIGV